LIIIYFIKTINDLYNELEIRYYKYEFNICDGFSTYSVYHLVGPGSLVGAVAPMNGFVAAAILKYFISDKMNERLKKNFLFILLSSTCILLKNKIILNYIIVI